MTTPTQAQIEAALTAYYGMELKRADATLAERMSAALAAAAEVKAPMFDQRTPDGPFELASGESMPAAEVGEQSLEWPPSNYAGDDIDRLHAENMALRIKLNATIERCAQVAIAELSPELGAEIAAAIRALKDKP